MSLFMDFFSLLKLECSSCCIMNNCFTLLIWLILMLFLKISRKMELFCFLIRIKHSILILKFSFKKHKLLIFLILLSIKQLPIYWRIITKNPISILNIILFINKILLLLDTDYCKIFIYFWNIFFYLISFYNKINYK
jgi:hypothetical protein